MRKLMSVGIAVLLVIGIFGALQLAWGQDVTAAITGTVVDPSGAAIKGATVTAKDVDRGTTYTTQTNDAGVFNILRIPIGTYSVTATFSGFETAKYPPFVLVLNQIARLPFQMKMGEITQTLEVTSNAPVLQTENAQINTVIDAQTNDDLPLATRNFLQLALLTPGALSVDPQSMNYGSNVAEESGRPYINGNREESNNFLLDGIDNNQASENLVGFTPSPDAIGEFNLITQNASAEFGNYNGGIVNATIKSGTNSYHGDVFEFFRNDKLNANTWPNGLGAGTPTGVFSTPKTRWNMFGGTFGGPIIKNKLFFFGDYQAGRLDFPSSASAITVLTPAEIGGNFSALSTQLYNPCAAGTGVAGTPCKILAPALRTPFNGNIIPSNMLNPAFTSLVSNALYPKSITTLSNGFGQAVNSYAVRRNSDQGDIKIDYNPSNSDRLSGRFSKGEQNDPSSNSVELLGNNVNSAHLDNTSVNWTHTFSPSLLNEARFGVNYVRFSSGITSFDSSVGALANTIGIEDGNPAGTTGLPLLGFGGGSITNPGSGALQNLGSGIVVENFTSSVIQFDDGLIYTHGRHVLKFGFQANRYRLNIFYSGNAGELGALLYGNGPGGNYSGNGAGGGDPAADWALGLPEDVGRGTSTGGWHQRDWLLAGYAQDDWRITNNLTLNIGLRYEARTPWVEVENHQENVNEVTGRLEYVGSTPVTGIGTNGFSRGLYKSPYGLPDFQPRFGFAWSPQMLGGKTVVRGSYTISSYLEGTGTNLRLTQNPPFTPPQVEAKNVATGTGYTTETGFASAAPPAGNPFVGATLLAWSPTVQPAIAQQWNLTVQREIANNTTVQLGYVGQHTTHLMVPEWLSQGDLLPDGTITYPYIGGQNSAASGLTGFGPNQLGNLKDTASVGQMNYNALQAVLQKRYSNGLETQVSWTYSKCMTDNDGYYGTWGEATETSPAANYWQNLYNPHGDYAQCYWDSKHVISAYAIYELPFGRGKQFGHDMPTALNAVVGNWSINPIVSIHTGFPLALYGPDDSGTGSPAPRPDCNGPVSYPKSVSNVGKQWFSPGAFSAPAAGTFGNCPAQGPVIGPGYTDFDISLQKNFQFTESKKLQFRADFLNAFNHPNFGHPDISFGDSNFGVINTSQDPRNIQLALKFYF
ncbi:MAG: carboxypeptidase regulatory-like domain-containing protein [Terriglobales bacterium]